MRPQEYKGLVGGKLSSTMERYGMGRSSIETIAAKAGAKVKIGRSAWYNWALMDKYLEEISSNQAAKV